MVRGSLRGTPNLRCNNENRKEGKGLDSGSRDR